MAHTPTFFTFSKKVGRECCRLSQRMKWGSTVFFVLPPVYKWCKKNSLKHNHVKLVEVKLILYSILFYSIIIVQKSRVSPTLFCSNCIQGKSRLSESTCKKVTSVGTTGIFHLIILNASSGSTLLFFVVTISIKSQLFLKNSSLFHEFGTVSKEKVEFQKVDSVDTAGFFT